MGAFLAKPNTEQTTHKGEGNGMKYGLCSMQGWRVDMEDAHTTVVSMKDALTKWSFFAVFDGHAGKIAAEICSKDLVEKISKVLNEDVMKGLSEANEYSKESVERVVKASFLHMDEILRDQLRLKGDRSGTTCTCLLITPQHYFFINCGDSRGLIVRDSKVLFFTHDHKPTNEEERDRIIAAGGIVMNLRINGSLAVSKALGDFDYKADEQRKATEQLVSPDPDVTCIERSLEQDEYICLACDGIFDVLSNDDLASYISSRLKITDDYEKISSDVINTCLHKGSRDNMSVILIALPGCVEVNQEAFAREKLLDETLEQNIKKLVEEFKERESDHGKRNNINEAVLRSEVINKLYTNQIEEIEKLLPPGGGIQSKYSKIDSILDKFCPNQNREETGGADWMDR